MPNQKVMLQNVQYVAFEHTQCYKISATPLSFFFRTEGSNKTKRMVENSFFWRFRNYQRLKSSSLSLNFILHNLFLFDNQETFTS